MQINELNSVDQITGSDLLPLWSQANGGTRKMSLTKFVNWLAGQNISGDGKVTQYASPVDGTTVTILDAQTGVWLVLSPSATISAATLKFPAVDNTVDKTEILINTTNTITTLTLDANGSSIVGGISTLAANGFVRFRYDIVMQTWYRVG